MASEHQSYQSQSNLLSEQLGNFKFELEQTKSFYEKKLEECEQRLGDLTASKIDNATQIEQMRNAMMAELDRVREERDRQLDAVKRGMADGEDNKLREKDTQIVALRDIVDKLKEEVSTLKAELNKTKEELITAKEAIDQAK